MLTIIIVAHDLSLANMTSRLNIIVVVLQGPVQRTKRIIRINRELPSGETELLATLEQPGNGGQPVLVPSPGSEKPAPLAAIEGADSLSPPCEDRAKEGTPSANTTPRTTSLGNMMSEDTAKTLYNIAIQPMAKPKPKPIIRNESMRKSGGPQSIGFTLPETNINQGSSGTIPLTRKSSVMSAEEESIQPYRPSLKHQMSIQEEDTTTCPCWLRKKKSRARTAAEKGRGMTQSELPSDYKALPGLQALLANYARMLYEEKVNFVKTLFRAVKLNKLDVTRILCKIIQKSGLTLSCKKLREPQSSATVLHVAVLYNSVDIVNYLVRQQDTELIMAKYETEEYRNQTVLHVAVAGGNTDLVRVLLESLDEEHKEELVNTVADGRYFRANHPFGALCLTTAAWAGRGEIIKDLVRHGADPSLKNRRGNTLLHCLILQSAQYPKRTDYQQLLTAVWEATALWADRVNEINSTNTHKRALQLEQTQIEMCRKLLAIRNDDGYTPLELGAATSSALYGHLINAEKIYKIPQNTLGSLTFVTYDVSDITSFAYNTYNKFSILHILAHCSNRLSHKAAKRADLLETEPINALLLCKWSVYRFVYIGWMVIHLSYMIIFTSVTIQTNSAPMTCTSNETCVSRIRCDLTCTAIQGEVHYGYAAFLIVPILYLVLEGLDLFGNQPYRLQYMSNQNYIVRLWKCMLSEWTIIGNGPYRMVMVAFCCFVLDWFVKYVRGDSEQEISLALALLLGWIFVLFFTRACRITCKLSIMIQKMFFRDLLYFLTVYGIVLIAFSFSVNAMFTYNRNSNAEITLNQVFYDMMNVVTDLDRKQTPHAARHDMFTKLLLIFYAILAVILLMNMLIAMMNTSYETVRITHCNLWRQTQLSVMLMIERRMFWWRWLCCKSERDVWRKTPTGTDLLGDEDEDVRSYLDVTVLNSSE